MQDLLFALGELDIQLLADFGLHQQADHFFTEVFAPLQNSINGLDLSKMGFLLSNEPFLTWWTQYPLEVPAMVGWMAGPDAFKYKGLSNEELLDMGLATLARILKIDARWLHEQVEHFDVGNWPADPYAKGSYSYTKVSTTDAYDRLREPIQRRVFFAGEALNPGSTTATVEGAFQSGMQIAEEVLSS